MLHLSRLSHFSRPLLVAAALTVTCCWPNIVTAQTDSASQPEAETEQDDDKSPETNSNQELFWVFLSSGKSLEGIEPEKIEQMQNSHLQNFKRLADEGKLLSAGSVSDPTKSMQGVAVFSSGDDKSLKQMFQPDELIEGGFQKIQATKMRLEHGVINAGKNGRSGMQEYRMIVIENAKTSEAKVSQETLDESRKAIETMYGDKDLRLAVRLGKNDSGRQLVLVLDKPEDESTLKTRLQKIPAIKNGNWKSRIMPVFFGKGTLNQS